MKSASREILEIVRVLKRSKPSIDQIKLDSLLRWLVHEGPAVGIEPDVLEWLGDQYEPLVKARDRAKREFDFIRTRVGQIYRKHLAAIAPLKRIYEDSDFENQCMLRIVTSYDPTLSDGEKTEFMKKCIRTTFHNMRRHVRSKRLDQEGLVHPEGNYFGDKDDVDDLVTKILESPQYSNLWFENRYEIKRTKDKQKVIRSIRAWYRHFAKEPKTAAVTSVAADLELDEATFLEHFNPAIASIVADHQRRFDAKYAKAMHTGKASPATYKDMIIPTLIDRNNLMIIEPSTKTLRIRTNR